jgi:hypothetical protein
MTKLREIITISNLYDLAGIFEYTDISEFKTNIRNIKSYLHEGYKYATNVKDPDIKIINIIEYIDILDTLELCAEAMLEVEEERHLTISFGGRCVNMEPLIDFLETMEAQSYTNFDISYIVDVMQNYLHESNIKEFKKGSTFMRKVAGHIMILEEALAEQVKPCPKN